MYGFVSALRLAHSFLLALISVPIIPSANGSRFATVAESCVGTNVLICPSLVSLSSIPAVVHHFHSLGICQWLLASYFHCSRCEWQCHNVYSLQFYALANAMPTACLQIVWTFDETRATPMFASWIVCAPQLHRNRFDDWDWLVLVGLFSCRTANILMAPYSHLRVSRSLTARSKSDSFISFIDFTFLAMQTQIEPVFGDFPNFTSSPYCKWMNCHWAPCAPLIECLHLRSGAVVGEFKKERNILFSFKSKFAEQSA